MLRRAPSVAAASLMLYGCAAHPASVHVEREPAGYIVAHAGRPGAVVAAPHGTSDPSTGDIAAAISRRTGFGLVVATGVAAERAYERRVHEAAGGRLVFYVEIHGNSRTDAAARIEVATVGVDPGHALQLKALLELTRDAHLRAHPDVPKLAVLVEPADMLVSAAGGVKREGLLLPERVLHLELPRAARREFREVYAAILSDFLVEAVSLRPLR
jgi:hypothetical protein